jgi:hypothetical protein
LGLLAEKPFGFLGAIADRFMNAGWRTFGTLTLEAADARRLKVLPRGHLSTAIKLTVRKVGHLNATDTPSLAVRTLMIKSFPFTEVAALKCAKDGLRTFPHSLKIWASALLDCRLTELTLTKATAQRIADGLQLLSRREPELTTLL